MFNWLYFPRPRLVVEDMHLEKIKAGLAWHYIKYAREQSAEDRERCGQADYCPQEIHDELDRSLPQMSAF